MTAESDNTSDAGQASGEPIAAEAPAADAQKGDNTAANLVEIVVRLDPATMLLVEP